MSSLKEFQTRYGAEWAQLISQPAFAAALALAHEEQVQKILATPEDDIATKGHIILADLRGHLKYEAALLGLHERKEFVFQQLGPEEYPNPETEAREEAEAAGQRVGDEMRSSGAFAGPSAHDQLFATPPPKKRGRPPGKKKLPTKRKPRKIRK